MGKFKERRKWRDNREEMRNCLALFGAVIKQAFDDVGNRNEIIRMKREFNVGDYKRPKDATHRYNMLKEEYAAGNDAVKFFETKRLERFITSHTLPIDVEYIRRKYKKLRKEMECQEYSI